MPMTVEQIEAEVLKLPEQARVELLGRLMRSLADTSTLDPDMAKGGGRRQYVAMKRWNQALSLVFLRKRCLRN